MATDTIPTGTADSARPADGAGDPRVAYTVLDHGIARIRLSRPHRLNAVTEQLVDELLAALRRAADDGVRAVVLCGAGRAFCSGHDLKAEPAPTDAAGTRARLDRIQDVTRLIRDAPFPVVAAVHGYALGAGCEFALSCDLVVAAEDARFGFPEVGVGLSVTGGVSRLLTTAVGALKAKELVLLGEHFDAREARRLGLVARVSAPGRHEAVALELAAVLAARPPFALALAKQLIDEGLDGTVDQALAREVAAAQITGGSGEHERPRQAFAQVAAEVGEGGR
ncbi:enoyl-CoA hydratase/isomerase family protein [Streptomyces catenulae]|uniref:Enoyl-CoA hydratase/isomerase family protein n=1 Tax=Streptomyces catenulae TaxID=66875 RepID=A0ABV2YS01_9ACTN|nr:enoyl-CoA hydratase/isomerase family protein [Streptomyces catenulae]